MSGTVKARRDKRGRMRLAAAGLALGLVVTACGGNGDDGENASAAEETAAGGENEAGSENEETAEAEGEGEATATDLELDITLADGYPSSNPNVIGGADDFRERIVEEGEKRGIAVNVEYFGDQSLASQAEMLDTVATGVADIAGVAFSYFAEVIPAVGISELPGRYESSEVGSQTLITLIQEEMMDDFNAENLRPVFVGTLAPYELFSVDTPISEPADTEGLNFRSPGGVCDDAVTAVGGVPVQMPVSDQYISLERGTIDGVIGPHANHRAYQIEEGVGYATDGLALCSVPNMYIANEDWFQSQPPEIQDLITEVGEQTSQNWGAYLDSVEEETTQYFEEYGMEIAEIEDTGPWEEATAHIQGEWVERMDGFGVNGQALIDRWDELAAEYS